MKTLMPDSLSPDLLQRMHAYWRAANYLSVGQIYLQGNPLLESPLRLENIKPRLLGHWGTTPELKDSRQQRLLKLPATAPRPRQE